ncbi:unnamed protein product [Parnassius apollo]|uniref:(apollo) hypothetical protein n=1 Tax=Parnassius apollo TaxID=110799 RepID=A0A8S3W4Q5_PARAO|nr:unnamed protein product [Parnassius apollo]
MSGFLNLNQIAQLLEDEDKESDSEIVQNTITTICDDEDISDCEEAEVVSCSEESTLGTDLDSLSSSSEEEEETIRTPGFYRGKNRYKWSKNPPSSSRIRQHNIITQRPGQEKRVRKLI